jgi:uncharacterized protein YacL
MLGEQTLGDGRVIPLIEKELFQGRFILVPQPVYEVNPPNMPNDETYTMRINENIERVRKIAKDKTMIVKKQLNKAEFLNLAKRHNATIITPNNETKSALMADVSQASIKTLRVIALSELYDILKPDYLPGSEFKVAVTKKGKEYNEGIGYLDGGVKVVVSGGARAIGKELEVVVQGSIETNVGKLLFAKPKYVEVK